MNVVRTGFTRDKWRWRRRLLKGSDDCAALKERQAFSRLGKSIPRRGNNVSGSQEAGQLREHGLFEASSFLL